MGFFFVGFCLFFLVDFWFGLGFFCKLEALSFSNLKWAYLVLMQAGHLKYFLLLFHCCISLYSSFPLLFFSFASIWLKIHVISQTT